MSLIRLAQGQDIVELCEASNVVKYVDLTLTVDSCSIMGLPITGQVSALFLHTVNPFANNIRVI